MNLLLKIIIGIVIVLIVIGLIVGIVYLVSKQPKKEETKSTNYTSIFVQSRDTDTKELVTSNYIIQSNDENHTILSQGSLDNSWNEIKILENTNGLLTCWSDSYYSNQVIINSNTERIYCDMQKIGQISLSYSGNIKTNFDVINLNISTEDYLRNIKVCFAWTSGIISVTPRQDYILCDSGDWINTSDNQYVCNLNYIQTCDSVIGNICKNSREEEIPNRYTNKLDSCYSTGQSIHNGTIIYPIEIKSYDNKNILDSLSVIVIDEDRRIENNNWIWKDDINTDDVNVSIPYNQN